VKVALEMAAQLFTHLREKNACLFGTSGDNDAMSISPVGGGFGQQGVNDFLRVIEEDNARLKADKARLEEELKRGKDESERLRRENEAMKEKEAERIRLIDGIKTDAEISTVGGEINASDYELGYVPFGNVSKCFTMISLVRYLSGIARLFSQNETL
jgi:hypothetical protein